MHRLEFSLALPTSATSPNDVAPVPDLRDTFGAALIYFQVLGIFSATYVLEMSVDGSTWVDASKQLYSVDDAAALTGGFTAAKLLRLSGNPPQMRFRCTGYVSGSPTVQILAQSLR